MTDIDAIKADREAGTPGPWQVSVSRWSEVFYGHNIGPDGNPVAKADYPPQGRYVSPEVHSRCMANARRIARVPEMEDTILAQADQIAALEAEVARLREALADAAGALDAAGEELWEFANLLSRDPRQANLTYQSAGDARAALKGEKP